MLSRAYAVGLGYVALVCLIWTFASVIVQDVEDSHTQCTSIPRRASRAYCRSSTRVDSALQALDARRGVLPQAASRPTS